MKRKYWIAALVVILAAAGLPFFPAELFRPPIQRALERSLGRKVEIGAVHFTMFPSWTPSPGFTLDEVTIHEDPRAGIEPFAYVDSLGASVRLLSLFNHKLEFSSLNLGGQTVSINLVKTPAGPWNFQYLLGGPAGSVGSIPALRMRGGRVNFKFGDTKSVFFFDDADLDVSPGVDGSVELRFGGAPARTDHTSHDFGKFFVRGTTSAGNRMLDFNIELERSSLEETLRLFDPSGFGMQGNIAIEARVAGPPSELKVNGEIQLGDVHHWDFLPGAGTLKTPFTGTMDLSSERLQLSASGGGLPAPVTGHLNARGLLSAPDWDASLDLAMVPVAPVLDVVRRIGIAIPEKLTAGGSVTGSLVYSRDASFSGHIQVAQTVITLPDAPPLAAGELTFDIGGESGVSTVRMNPATLRVGENRSVEFEGSAAFGSSGVGTGESVPGAQPLDFKISSRGLPIATMRALGLVAVPLLEHTSAGAWRGTARYHAGEWSGDSELLDARIPVDGLANPIQIKSAAISLNGKRAAITRLQAKAGDITFTAEYRWEQGARRPHKFRLAIAEADAAELQRLLAPALVRERGFLARTLGLRSGSLPEWLAARHAEGLVTIDSVTAGDTKVHNLWTRLLWDAGTVHLTGLNAALAPGSIAGDVTVDLTAGSPQFHFEGDLRDVPWKGGRIDLEGTLDAEGSGLQLLETVRAEGRLKGRSIAFAPDADFRSVSGDFQAGPGLSRWKLSNLEIAVGPDNLTGSGVSQADGRLVLDLTNRGRPVRYAGPLLAAGTAP